MRLLDDIHHLAILTAVIDRLIAFYERISDAGVTMDLEEDGLRHAFITVGPRTVLHAFQVPGVVPPTDQPTFRRGRGCGHRTGPSRRLVRACRLRHRSHICALTSDR
jgi:catechol 2,3-dioxygenase-like lactoylglutathione lyase family enzyme